MKTFQDLLLGLPLVECDEVAGFSCYKTRSERIRRGEFEFMHILFRSIISEPISSVRIETTNPLAADSDHSSEFLLPSGYGEFLRFTNGAYLFGGNVMLFGLDSDGSDNTGFAKYRPQGIIAPNILARNMLLNSGDFHLGTYFYSQRLLIFNQARSLLELTKPFSRSADKSWSSFDDYVAEELTSYSSYFNENGGMLHSAKEFL